MRASGSWDDEGCTGTAVAVPAARAKQYERILASRREIHAAIPELDVDLQPAAAADDEDDPDAPGDSDTDTPGTADNPDDMATYLASTMTWYIEWPHVDDTFRALYRSLPGYNVSDAE